MVVLCQLKELGLSCFGCCGNSYGNKRELKKDIKLNTREFNERKSLKEFMTRETELRDSGVCANLILKNGRFVCPGHPAMHGGRDYRNLDPDCDKEYICKTFGLFQRWDEKKKKEFLAFLKKKKLDNMTYSIKMDNNSLLKEFEETN